MEVIAMPKFICTEIHISNIERSMAFYTKELGMKLLKREAKETRGKVAWLRHVPKNTKW
jgi:catechol 2,3-dioxygenase-like lactoylglutathione lyase family enzyme